MSRDKCPPWLAFEINSEICTNTLYATLMERTHREKRFKYLTFRIALLPLLLTDSAVWSYRIGRAGGACHSGWSIISLVLSHLTLSTIISPA